MCKVTVGQVAAPQAEEDTRRYEGYVPLFFLLPFGLRDDTIFVVSPLTWGKHELSSSAFGLLAEGL